MDQMDLNARIDQTIDNVINRSSNLTDAGENDQFICDVGIYQTIHDIVNIRTAAEIDSHNLGSLYDGYLCPHCQAYLWPQENKSMCCNNGKIKLPMIKEPSGILRQLYEDPPFLNNIRQFNNAFAMASMGCDEVRETGFTPTFKIHGKVYHRIGPIIPESGRSPKFAQVFFYDQDEELEHRANRNSNLSRNSMETLQKYLHTISPHIRLIKLALKEFEAAHKDFKIVFTALPATADRNEQRTHSIPESGQVSAVIPANGGHKMDIIIEKQGLIRRIHELHRLYDPLHYVLLLPHGEDGYCYEVSQRFKNVTLRTFYQFYLQVREVKENFNHFMRSGRLIQQYACDQFVKMECFRMRWFYQNQKSIRAEKYSGLIDALHSGDDFAPGRRIVLPPSHYGSPRWYAEAYQNAMALVRHYGKPDLFVTFTCNPNWPEIQTSLLPNQQPKDIPDIVGRVFRLKLKELLQKLTIEHVLGRVVAYTAMIEYQKRGMPHCHILLILHKDEKILREEQVDAIICAELPDEQKYPKLFDIISRTMIHGPCGQLNPDSPCMKMGADGKKSCGRAYPKDFNNGTTTFNDASYPTYRRRDTLHGGHKFIMTKNNRNITIDNSMVVPYNPYLSLYFNAHLNVEIVSDTGAVKYLYKYIMKGSDKTVFSLAPKDTMIDEIELFETGRFVGSSEAFWRIYGFPVSFIKPSVFKLSLHLENEQSVLFNDDDVEEAIADGPPKTHLTEYFELVRNDPMARSITYPDICRHFSWNKAKKEWVRRKLNVSFGKTTNDCLSDMVGRVPIVNLSPKQAELYFLRMLLYQKTGSTSFEALRTVDGTVCQTYEEACKRLGLIEHENELDMAMNEMSSITLPQRLRRIFATLLAFRKPIDPPAFFERHVHALCEDFRMNRNSQTINEVDRAMALRDIQSTLDGHGLMLERDFRIEIPPVSSSQLYTPITSDYDVGTLKNLHDENVKMLTDEQQVVYDKVMSSVKNKNGNCYLLNAPGGTGKTFLLTTIIAALRSDSKVVVATALSGLAALLLPKGRTLHSALKVPLDLEETSTCNISPRDSIARMFRDCKLLVIDEFSMGHRYIYEAIDRTLRDIRNNENLFGGLTVLFSGDCRQILPIVHRGGRSETIAACFKSSPIFQHVETIKLTRNLRLENPDDECSLKFQKYLLEIGNGTTESDENGYIRLEPEFLLKNNTLSGLYDFVYNGLMDNYKNMLWFCLRSILCPKNEEVAEVNEHMHEKFPGDNKEFKSADKLLEETSMCQYPTEFLNKITYGMPPHSLNLKVGSPIMLLRNLDPKRGHCNGTRYVVSQLHQHMIDATVISGLNVGERKFIPRIPTIPNENKISFRMQRLQFPVRLAFAMTINKAQGQSLDKVGLFLKTNVFTHGQLYVAMSRCRNPSLLKIVHCSESTHPKMKNVVYEEILNDV